jgi:hypothetical protein
MSRNGRVAMIARLESRQASAFLISFICGSVHAIMGNLLSELDSCPDVEALSCEISTGA